MNPPKDIIRNVKELRVQKVTHPHIYNQSLVNKDIIASFPALSQALINQEEKLKIAVEALEQIREEGDLAEYDSRTDIAEKALNSIQSTPTP